MDYKSLDTQIEIYSGNNHELILDWIRWNDRNGAWWPEDPDYAELSTEELRKVMIGMVNELVEMGGFTDDIYYGR
jgi:hypothetical protein